MLPSGHFAAGYLVSTALVKMTDINLSISQVNVITIIGIFSAVAPDLDLVYYFIRKKKGKLNKNESHRFYVTHAPILWLILGLGIYFFGGTEFWQMVGLAVWIGSWSHFILDSIEFGIPWLWPISKKVFALKRDIPETADHGTKIIRSQWDFIINTYPKMITSFVEILIIAFAVITFLTPHISASSLN
ncbi:MAG: metal-dependent hydrolase [Candidatus Paceibacterota bacterium]